jgi:hypothetical protein
MTPLGYLTLFSLLPVIFLLFALFPARQAVIYSFLWAWLFLPFKAFSVHGLEQYSKVTVTPLGVLLAALVFDADRVLAVRPKIWDIPIFVYTISPFFASMHNSPPLSAYDGLNAVLGQYFLWTGGYVIGRIYFTDLEGMRDLAFGFIAGGLLYVPFCLYEVRMSPQLNEKVYGFMQYAFGQSRRGGGFRPIVFMQHGIALGCWMMSCGLVAGWLWMCGTFKHRWGFSGGAWVLLLLVTLALCHAVEAIALMLVAGVALLAVKWFRTKAVLIVLVLAPPVYTFLRAEQLINCDGIVQALNRVSEDRAKSIQIRLFNEDLLVAKAWGSPVYGWGGWNRFQVQNSRGVNIAVPDQQWILAFGKTGLIGLISFEAALLLPVIVLIRRVPVRYWTHPAIAPAVALALVSVLHLFDCLLNAFVNPIFMMACGGVTGMLPVAIKVVSPQQPAARPPQGLLASGAALTAV